jgi:hypothetical protein
MLNVHMDSDNSAGRDWEGSVKPCFSQISVALTAAKFQRVQKSSYDFGTSSKDRLLSIVFNFQRMTQVEPITSRSPNRTASSMIDERSSMFDPVNQPVVELGSISCLG